MRLQGHNLEERVAELTARLEQLQPATEQAQALLEENQGLRAELAWQLQTNAQSKVCTHTHGPKLRLWLHDAPRMLAAQASRAPGA